MVTDTGPAQGEALSVLLDGGKPTAVALVAPEDGQGLTYGELATRIETVAGLLAGAGVRRGDRVAMALPNGPECIELLLAVIRLGAAAAPLNSGYTESEFAFFLGDIAPRLLITQPGQPRSAISAAMAAAISVLTVTGGAGGPPELHADGVAVRSARSFEPGEPDDVGIVLHTSGTTSRPKQVPLRQRNLMASVRTVAGHYRLGPADSSFCAMPLF